MSTVFTALGDPLIKGLTEVANVKPKDPVAFLASFLHNFPENEKPQIGTQVTKYHILITGRSKYFRYHHQPLNFKNRS